MSPVLTLLAVSYLGLVALIALLAAAGVRCGHAAVTGAVVVELLLIANAVADVMQLGDGRPPNELTTHLGYVIVSVVILPVMVSLVHRRRDPDGGLAGPRHAVLALACVVAAVVVVRQQQTLA